MIEYLINKYVKTICLVNSQTCLPFRIDNCDDWIPVTELHIFLNHFLFNDSYFIRSWIDMV